MPPPGEVLQTALQYLKGVGPRKAADFARAGLHTIEDLLYRFPLRYEDRGNLRAVASVQEGETVTISGEIVQCGLRPTRRPGFRIFEALVRDASGSIRVAWFNSSFLQDQLHARDHIVLYGTLERNPYAGLQFTNPDFELIETDGPDAEADTLHTGRIVPVYERARSITPKMQRRLVADALLRLPADLEDPLPTDIRARLGFPDRRAALDQVHFPPIGTPLEALNAFQTLAQRRLVFEEFFRLPGGPAAAQARIRGRAQGAGDACGRSHPRRAPGRAAVPPDAGSARSAEGDRRRHAAAAADEPPAAGRRRRRQDHRRAARGGRRDGERAAGRVHGADRNPRRAALHDVAALLAGIAVPRRLLTGRRRPRPSAAAHGKAIAAGEMHLVVGTHALVQEDGAVPRARPRGHRRAAPLRRAAAGALREKGQQPDMLVMTATPIPRTLALTIYGDLDVS